MQTAEIRKLADLEDRHWWYRERRAMVARELRRFGAPGRALDIGAAGGGNTRVMQQLGWAATAIDYSETAVEIACGRGVPAIHADARELPIGRGFADFVVALDVLEHIEEDHLVTQEMARVLRPGGAVLIGVPCDMALWSAHDVSLGHVRRYSRESLVNVVEKAGLVIDRLWSWNVLLRPIVAWRRRTSSGCDLDHLPALVNSALSAIIAAERVLPVKSLPGVSLILRAHRE